MPDNGITLDDVLEAVVGNHHPEADEALDHVSAANTGKLHYIGLWAAQQLSLEGRLEDCLASPYASARHVAQLHDQAIMTMLEWFEPQVKRYYEEWLKEEG